VHEQEARLVRHIMQRYLDLGSVVELAEDLNAQGYRTKVQRSVSGPHRGGCLFQRGTLYHLLSNRIYIGELRHKGEHFASEHPPIIPRELWDAVQAKLRDKACGISRRLKAQQPSLLTGLVFDGEGRAMAPSHATRPGKRYRYFVTRSDLLDRNPAWRVSAFDLEQLVCGRLSAQLMDQHFIALLGANHTADELQQLFWRADLIAATLRSGGARDKVMLLPTLLERINLREDGIDIIVDLQKIGSALGELIDVDHVGEQPLLLSLPAVKVRRGHQLRLVLPGPQTIKAGPANRNEKVVALVAEAHQARQLVQASPNKSLAAIAAAQGRCRTRLGKLAALACLAPDIVTAIVEGRQPADLTASALLSIELPLCWKEQRKLLGFS
jgi:hypothetical protein